MTEVLRLALPLTLWLISFSALYGLHGVVCAADWPLAPGPSGIAWGRLALLAGAAAAILVQLAALVALGWTRLGPAPGFMRRTTLTLAAAALIAAIWTSLPAAVLPVCV